MSLRRSDKLQLSADSERGVWLCGRQEKYGQIVLPSIAVGLDGQVSEELCASAATMANHLNARAIFVYTRRGYMANFLSRCRPDCPIFAFTGMALICTRNCACLSARAGSQSRS